MSSANANVAVMTVAKPAPAEVTAPAPAVYLDGTLVAMALGLVLWFVCAVMVITTFVHPGAPEQAVQALQQVAPITAGAPVASLAP